MKGEPDARFMRTALALAVLFVGTLLAGCIGGDDADLTVPETPLTNTPTYVLNAVGETVDANRFGAELPVFDMIKLTDRISGEPTVGVTRTGAIFYASIAFDVAVPGYGTLPSTVYYRSTDNGATWEDKSPQMAGVKTHPTSFDPYVYVDPTTGRVFAMDMGPHIACNKVSWSDDDGESWITREGACIPGGNDHPSIWAGPATAITNTAVYPNNVYLCTNAVSNIHCYLSPDGGITWIEVNTPGLGYDPDQANIVTNPTNPEATVNGALDGLCGALHGHGHTSWADGTTYLGRSNCGVPTVHTSQDGGLTWETTVISTDPKHDQGGLGWAHDISIATDSAGNAYAFWLGDFERSAYLAVSKDSGQTWGTPINVTAPGLTAVKLASIVAGDEGRIAFLYVGTETPLGWDVHERECTTEPAPIPIVTSGETTCEWVHPDELDNTTWNGYIGMSLNADTDDPVFATTLAHPADQPLKRGPCNGRCTGAGYGMYDFLDIDINPVTGEVYAALVDVCVEACDEPDATYFETEEDETSVGTISRVTSGVRLLAEPIAER